MKIIKTLWFPCICLILFVGCKSTSSGPILTSTNKSIIGSWEGCDGRIILFTKEENSDIIGRYTKLGGLEKYKFTLNEVGYKLTQKSPGIYIGMVKWQDLSGNETWKKVTISIENNDYSDDQSDSCSKDMKRINP